MLQYEIVNAAANPLKEKTVKYVSFTPEAVVCSQTLTDNSSFFKTLTQFFSECNHSVSRISLSQLPSTVALAASVYHSATSPLLGSNESN